MLDSIPLQIQVAPKKAVAAINATEADSDEKKKKKKKKEDRKDKKKKKRSKKRKHTSSSSSSSGTSGSETDAPTDKHKDDSSHSIRVAMRNLLKQQQNEKIQMTENASGKWTVVQPAQFQPAPPPPTISANGAASDKKDELMISQWNAPEAIISEKEKKLLEELKGRLKNRSDDREASSMASKPERERGSSRDRRRSRSRSRSRDRMERRGRRSRSRGGRRSKSRSRSPRWGRRRSRSRSHGRRIEKPIVRYPEFRPRVPEKDKKKSKGDNDASDTKNDKKSSMSTSKKTTSSTKKLPFIGRMPVFKKQTNGKSLFAICS